jgi:hypothetical protein
MAETFSSKGVLHREDKEDGSAVWVHNASYFNPALRVNPPEIVAALRKAFNSTERAAFIRHWVTSPQAKRLLTPAEMIHAARKGELPERFIVHHMTPLYRGGTNAFDNLRVTYQRFHHKFREILHNYPGDFNPYIRFPTR